MKSKRIHRLLKNITIIVLALSLLPVASADNFAYNHVPWFNGGCGAWVVCPASLNNVVDNSFVTSSNTAQTNAAVDDGNYIQLDMEAMYNLTSISAKIDLQQLGGGATASARIKVSGDNSTWTTVVTNTTPGGSTLTHNFTHVGTWNGIRYIRYSVWDSVGGASISTIAWYEIQADGVLDEPALISPANGSTQYYNYPPQTTSVNFTWSSGASAYNIQVAKDINFNLISVDTTVSTNYSVQSLQGTQQYWWRAATYNSTTGTRGNWSDIFNFTLTANTTTTGTGIQGVVYEINDDGDILPIEGATVYIANSTLTYSASQITGSNGYYLFNDLSNQTTYSIYATKNNYLNSQTEYVTTGLGNISTKDILMRRCISGFECGLSSQYVKFIVQDLWGTTYTGVTATVYLNDAVTSSDGGITGSDGAVVFFMVKDQRYRLTFIDATQGINTVFYVTPSDTLYFVIVSQTIPVWGDSVSEHEAIALTVYNNLVGSTGYINATYNDTIGGTTSLIFYLNQTNHTNGSSVPITVQTINAGAVSNYSANFTGIASAGGNTYLVNVVAVHSTYGTIYRTLGVRFAGVPSNILSFIDDGIKALLAIAFMFFVGAMATERTRAMVSLLVCVLGWAFLFMGLFNYFNTTAMAGGLVMGSLISVVWNISERRKSEGIT